MGRQQRDSSHTGLGIIRLKKMGDNYEVDEAGIIMSQDRLVILEAPGTFLIDSMDKFPAPVAGVITLPATKQKYILTEPLTTSDRFVIPAGAEVEFAADSIEDDVFTYTGNDTFFTVVDAVDFALTGIEVDNAGGAGILMSVDGVPTTIVNIFRTKLKNWTSLGLVKDIQYFLLRNSIVTDFGSGIVIDDVDIAVFDLCIFQNSSDSGTDFIEGKTTVKSGVILQASGCSLKTQPTEYAFFLPSASDGAAIITNIFSVEAGRLFNPAGKDEQVNNIIAENNIGQKSSKSIGAMTAQGNGAATVINTPGVFEKLNLNALAVADIDIERWEIADTTTGGLRYIGESTFSGEGIATISSAKVGGGGDIQVAFRFVVDGIDGYQQVTETRNTISETTVTKGFMVEPNQVVEVEVANLTDTSDINVQDIRVSIK